MIGLRPGFVDPRAERRAGPAVAVISITALVLCTVIASMAEHGSPAQWRGTLFLAAGTALWLLLLIPLVPRRTRNPLCTIGFFAGLLAASTFLAARLEIFTAFGSVGYPIAFVLFTARWSIFAAAATALVPLLAKGFWQADTAPWVTVVSVVGPILYAAWFAGAESEQRRRTNQQLTTALAENAALQEKLLVQARESGIRDERQRMAREIHDTVAQGLTGIVTQLRAADQAQSEKDRQRHLGHVHALAKDSLTEARRAVQALRPEPLADARLPEALADLARRTAERTGADVTARAEGTPRPLPAEQEATLYRITQEALANAEKHAAAGRIVITLTYTETLTLLDIRDDGRGFAAGDRGAGTGFGLEAMQQRVHQVAGTLTVESAPGEGTAVHVELPVR